MLCAATCWKVGMIMEDAVFFLLAYQVGSLFVAVVWQPVARATGI